MIKIIEILMDNYQKYIDQIAALEITVLERMEKEGRVGQLFITGKEDILEYVKSKENSVFVALNDKENVIAATYITQGQKPFTYNDITKYFKCGEGYDKYVREQYETEAEYENDRAITYRRKLEAFKVARDRILIEHPEYESIEDFLNQEMLDNGFHEKSALREGLIRYMSEYIESKYGEEGLKGYERFFWMTLDDIYKGRKQANKVEDAKQYDEFLKKAKLQIIENEIGDVEKYYNANTTNAIEIDTYLTNPDSRESGLARIIVSEGIKKHIEKYFESAENKELFLCSTLHRQNVSSKYVSEFFGLKDSVFVNRRQGRDREVHILGLKRREKNRYLKEISEKLAVLYGYNPNNIEILPTRVLEIKEEELEYQRNELKRLKHEKEKIKALKLNGEQIKFKGFNPILRKISKIKKLKKEIKELKQEIGVEVDDGR